jgi:RNA polymerase sigma-70 factor (ECF subfamily)
MTDQIGRASGKDCHKSRSAVPAGFPAALFPSLISGRRATIIAASVTMHSLSRNLVCGVRVLPVQGGESGNHDASAAFWHARIAAALEGDRHALGEIFEKLRPYLRSRAQEQLDQQLQIKVSPSDLVQETLLEVHRGFAEFHGQSRAELVVWVQGILNHRVQTAYRRYRGTGKRDLSREVRLQENEESKQQIQFAAAQSSPSDQAIAGEDLARLEQALQELPPRYEQVIRLRNELGLSFQEVGIALGCSADAARKLWSRAVDQLAKRMNPN